MYQIEVFGLASNKKISTLWIENSSLHLTLMEFLRGNNIPVASSCFGEGVCQKCVVNDGLLSCQVELKSLFKRPSEQSIPFKVSISYL